MTPADKFRPLVAVALVMGLFVALPGCSGDKPNPDNKGKEKDKGGKEPDAGSGAGSPGTGGDANAGTRPPAKVDASIEKEATDFLTATATGTVKADKLSAAFVKTIGLPAVPDSASAAESWLKGLGTGFGPPFTSKQVGDVALFRGGLVGKDGGYCLRMIKEGGAWKVDYLALSSAKLTGSTVGPSGEAALQEFAAVSFAEALADKTAMPKEQRAMAVAAAMTPASRAKWAPPFDSDKKDGFDYNRGAMALKLGEFTADAVSVAQQGDGPAFRVEFTQGGAKKAYLVKLTKGDANRWLVEDVTPQ